MSKPTEEERAVLIKMSEWYHASAKDLTVTLPYPTLGDAEAPTTQLHRVARAVNANALIKGQGVLTFGGPPITLSDPRWRAEVGFPDAAEDARIAAMRENCKP